VAWLLDLIQIEFPVKSKWTRFPPMTRYGSQGMSGVASPGKSALPVASNLIETRLERTNQTIFLFSQASQAA
jgi:hypothetical protein